MGKKLYMIGENLTDNNDHCGCCSDTSSYNSLKCYLRNTFKETDKVTDSTLYTAVTADGTAPMLTFKDIVNLHNSSESVEDYIVDDPNWTAPYTFTELTEKQHDWIKNKTDFDIFLVREVLMAGSMKKMDALQKELKKICFWSKEITAKYELELIHKEEQKTDGGFPWWVYANGSYYEPNIDADTEGAKAYIDDTDLYEFAKENGLGHFDEDDEETFVVDYGAVEKACNCKLDCNYDGNHAFRQFSENLVTFN